MTNGEVAFRKLLYADAVKKEKKLRKESNIQYGFHPYVENLEKLYESDMKNGTGFVLDVTCKYDDTSANMETELIDADSIYSYKFSIRSNDTKYAKDRRYRCQCGATEEELAGVPCPKCGTETYNHIAIRGWFDLGEYKVFNPFFWTQFISNCKIPKLMKLIPLKKKSRLTKIRRKIKQKYKNTTPPVSIINYMMEIDSLPSILELRDKEVLKKLIVTYANDNSVQYFLDNIDCAMTSKIPCINKNMQNSSTRVNLNGVSNTRRDPVTKYYITISRILNTINDTVSSYSGETTVESKLISINTQFNNIYESFKHVLGVGKESMIRGKAGGRRKGYSSRLVLEGYINHKVDEAAMPYKFFGQMTVDYHYDLYEKLGMTPESSFRIKNNIPNKKDKEMMDKVLETLTRDNLNVIIALRQPAIYRESMVALRLVELHEEDVLRVNEMVIDSCMVGDKDGDVVSVFMPDPSIRTQLLFSLSPNKRIFNPLTVSVEGEMELVEAGYVNVCLVLPKEREGSIIVTKEELKKMGYDVGE